MRWAAATLVLAGVAVGADSCTAPVEENTSCAEGKGHWIEDESEWLAKGYTVIVRLCVDDGGNVLDLEVE